MFLHEFRENFVLALELLFQEGDLPILGIAGALGAEFEGGGAVLEELLLPAVEHRGVDAVLVTQIRDGDVFEEMEPKDGDLLLGGESLASLLGHGTTSARNCSLFERSVFPIPSEAKQEQLDGDLANAQEHVTIEKGHGREEMRTYLQLPAPESLPGFTQWKGLKSIGIVTSQCVRDGKETIEVRYYMSSLTVGVKLFAHAVRSHWGIENSCHWSLDITYREDESRIRDKHLRENFAWLRRLTLSLLKQHPGPESVAMKRRSCGWSEDFMLEVLTVATT
jgi:predicted transposase YbfD/YdcC